MLNRRSVVKQFIGAVAALVTGTQVFKKPVQTKQPPSSVWEVVSYQQLKVRYQPA